MNNLLTLTNLTTTLNTSRGIAIPVDHLTLKIKKGETYALLGESGCGKSMTALSIMQLLPPIGNYIEGSEVNLNGQNLLSLSEAKMRGVRGKKIGMIFQEPMTSLNPVLTVGEQIGEVLDKHLSLSKKAYNDRIQELLNSVGIPEPQQRVEEYPHQLSGGMKQRVMIAMAIAAEPELLIADEPTTALDVTIQAQVLKLLKDLQKKTGMAILLITHDLGVVKNMADRVGVMYAGHLVEEASSEQFFSDPRHPYSQKLFDSLPTMIKRDQELSIIKGMVPPLTEKFHGCRFADRCPHVWDDCRTQNPAWTPQNNDAHVRCHIYDENHPKKESQIAEKEKVNSHTPTQKETSNKILLQASDLKIHFPIKKGLFKRTIGYVKAVDGVDLEIKEGQTLALVGESGSGKTTIGKGILQLLKVTSGHVEFENIDLSKISRRALHKKRKDFQIIFQDPYSSLNPRMLVGQIIAEGMKAQGSSEAEQEKAVSALLLQVGMPEEAQLRYPHEFSGGQRQRICIARALAVKPRLIICDEPTSALDVSVQAQILNLLNDLQKELNLSYLFISHNISVVSYLAHEVAVMYQGKIVERGSVEKVLQRPEHPYTQSLLAAVPIVGEIGHRKVVESDD